MVSKPKQPAATAMTRPIRPEEVVDFPQLPHTLQALHDRSHTLLRQDPDLLPILKAELVRFGSDVQSLGGKLPSVGLPSRSSLRWSDLSAEVRNLIYRYTFVLGGDYIFLENRSSVQAPRSAQFLACNKQIYTEGRSILYGENFFEMNHCERTKLVKILKPECIPLLRKIVVFSRYLNKTRLKDLCRLPGLKELLILSTLPLNKDDGSDLQNKPESRLAVARKNWTAILSRAGLNFMLMDYLKLGDIRCVFGLEVVQQTDVLQPDPSVGSPYYKLMIELT